MRGVPNLKVESFRIRDGRLASTTEYGNCGQFLIPLGRTTAQVIVSDLGGWEHVSVSIPDGGGRVPTWSEMCAVKDLFWRDDETVIQYHPPKKNYVNENPAVLHLWRPLAQVLPAPSPAMVGRLDPLTVRTSLTSMPHAEAQECLRTAIETVVMAFPFPVAITLAASDYGDQATIAHYISNCDRSLAVKRLRELADRLENDTKESAPDGSKEPDSSGSSPI